MKPIAGPEAYMFSGSEQRSTDVIRLGWFILFQVMFVVGALVLKSFEWDNQVTCVYSGCSLLGCWRLFNRILP